VTTLAQATAAAEPKRRSVGYYFFKRCFDSVVALSLLLLLAPVLLLIALLIVLESRGAPLFVQERVGSMRVRRGRSTVWEARTFRLYKFRSMRQSSGSAPDPHVAHIQAFVAGHVDAATNGGTFKLSNDPRVTRVGRFLRRTSIDELPQLINVLKGEMSLVGPRPSPTYEVSSYDEWHYRRLEARPGLTGLWQVSGRCELSFEEMVELDVEYVRRQSLLLDLKLLVQTIPAVFAGRGAG
jgi:lipopolysaccharide/colanic/teichoic acid biosynthesis glycosyltransferase